MEQLHDHVEQPFSGLQLRTYMQFVACWLRLLVHSIPAVHETTGVRFDMRN